MLVSACSQKNLTALDHGLQHTDAVTG